MSRGACLVVSLILAGCAQSDAVTGPLDRGVALTTTAASGGSGGGPSGAGTGGDESSAGGDDATSSPTSSASSGSGGEGGGGGSAGAGGTSGCGDGVVLAPEECDDANEVASDGCTACVIDCVAPGAKEPTTGHCYQVFPDATTWPFAEANCAAWGGSAGLGHLASIADDVEQTFVFGLITSQAWIGIQDPVTEGVYQWSDGSLWDYEHWAPGEPDNTNEEDCAFMRTTDAGGWNDHACGDARPSYVCERRGAGTF